jgi:hypothetical protein
MLDEDREKDAADTAASAASADAVDAPVERI